MWVTIQSRLTFIDTCATWRRSGRPLTLSLTIPLVVSYIISVTIIPILAPYILKRTASESRFEALVRKGSDYFVNAIRDFFVGTLDFALRQRLFFVVAAFVVLVISLNNVKPLADMRKIRELTLGAVCKRGMQRA